MAMNFMQALGAMARGTMAGQEMARQRRRDEASDEWQRQLRSMEMQKFPLEMQGIRDRMGREKAQEERAQKEHEFEYFDKIPKIAKPIGEKLGGAIGPTLGAATGMPFAGMAAPDMEEAAPKMTSRFPEFGVDTVPRDVKRSDENRATNALEKAIRDAQNRQELERMKQSHDLDLERIREQHRLGLKLIGAEQAAQNRTIPSEILEGATDEELKGAGITLNPRQSLFRKIRQRKGEAKTDAGVTKVVEKDAEEIRRRKNLTLDLSSSGSYGSSSPATRQKIERDAIKEVLLKYRLPGKEGQYQVPREAILQGLGITEEDLGRIELELIRSSEISSKL
jgi:hypothetical protein